MVSDIINYFPFDSFRIGQKESITEIIDAIDNGYKNIVFDASTGSGKSSVARTVIDYFNQTKGYSSFLLSSTKMLQNQYYLESKEFNKFGIDYQVGKGRNNFTCVANTKLDCNKGECKTSIDTKFHCPFGLHRYEDDDIVIGSYESGKTCEYWEQKKKAITSEVCILNYDVLLSDYPNHYKHRDLMICDEAHNIDQKIMNRVSITLSETRLADFGVFLKNEDFYKDNANLDYWLNRLKEISSILTNHHTSGYYISDNHKVVFNKYQLDGINHLNSKINERIIEIKEDPYKWFIDIVSDAFGKKITIKPIDVHEYVAPLLLNKADYHVFMSGSIIDYNNFIKYLGLNEDDTYYVYQESSFDNVNRNPIFKQYCGKLTYKEKNDTLPKVYPIIQQIITNHMSDKGIIHCNSREFANKVLDNCFGYDRFIKYDSSREKDEAIEELKESENGIIVAYSLEEGLDLPNDDLRFQILLKCPYPNLGDKQIKARANNDYRWYQIETIRKFVQTIGRGMRNKDDYCTNYVIDSSFKDIIRNKYCPKYIKDSIKEGVI